MAIQVDIKTAHCNKCLNETNHHIVFTHSDDWSEALEESTKNDEITIYGKCVYELLKCCGCDTKRILFTSWFSEHTDLDGRSIPTLTYYPPIVNRKMPDWLANRVFADGDHFVARLLRQIYDASTTGCYALAAMGIRALLEQTMIDKIADQGSFKKNLDKFQSAGYVGTNQRQTLETTLELGHAAIHRNFNPSGDDIRVALEITEGILSSVYVQDGEARALKGRIP